MIKDTNNYSTTKIPSTNIQTDDISLNYLHDIDQCQLQTKFHHKIQIEETITKPTAVLTFILTTILSVKNSRQLGEQRKSCGHYCFLKAAFQCCSCSGMYFIVVDKYHFIIFFCRSTALF